ncbi:MAG: T9SS type A sorting domain-containing protein [Bacteroidota bacterium]
MKGFITGTLLMVLAYGAQAQVTFNQQVDFGEFGFPFHVLTSVLPTDSCYYATGIISDTTDGFFAYGGIFVKFDLQGEMLFFKKLTSPDRDYFLWRGDLVATPDGNLVDIGITVDSITRGILIKYSPQGDTLFTREYLHPFYPTESFLYAAGLKVARTDRIMALFGVDTDTSSGISNMDSYLLTLDPLGNILDSNIYGDNIKENPKRLVMAGDGGVLVPSIRTNSNLVNMNYVSRAHVFKVDTLGKKEWEYLTPQGQLFNFASDLTLAPDGGLVAATGKGIEVMVNAETAILKWFPYFLKLDADHKFEWGREFRGTRPDLFTMDRVVSAADGSGYVGVSRIGEDVSIGEEVLGSWLMKVSPEGDSLWARYYSFFDGINARPNPYDLKNTPDGGYVICGETDPSNIGDIKDGSWLMKVDEHGCLIPGCQLVSTDDLPGQPVKLAIYPNPVSRFLNFQLRGEVPQLKGGRFRIIDASGRALREVEDAYPGDTHILSISEWPSGTYFLQYILDGQIITSERFIKN